MGTQGNFTLMYHQTYDALVKSRIAIELEDNIFLEKEGQTVLGNGVDIVVNVTKYKIFLPGFQLRAVKVVSNTNTKKYKVLKEKTLCHSDNHPHQIASSSDHHYTTLEFTSGGDQPV